jgi:hypothetical protein
VLDFELARKTWAFFLHGSTLLAILARELFEDFYRSEDICTEESQPISVALPDCKPHAQTSLVCVKSPASVQPIGDCFRSSFQSGKSTTRVIYSESCLMIEFNLAIASTVRTDRPTARQAAKQLEVAGTCDIELIDQWSVRC